MLGDCSKQTNLGLIDKMNVGNEATDRSGQALAPLSPHFHPVHEHPSAEQQPESGAAFPEHWFLDVASGVSLHRNIAFQILVF